MKKCMFLILSVLFAQWAYSQEGAINSVNPQQLTVKSNVFGTRIYRADQMLNYKQTALYLKDNQEASRLFGKARGNNTVASIFGGVGGFLIGYSLGTALGGGEPQWGLAAAGGGVLLLGLPFSLASSKHAKRAVEVYNQGLAQGSSKGNEQFKLYFAAFPQGFQLRFDF